MMYIFSVNFNQNNLLEETKHRAAGMRIQLSSKSATHKRDSQNYEIKWLSSLYFFLLENIFSQKFTSFACKLINFIYFFKKEFLLGLETSKSFFFLMWTIFKVFIEFITIFLLFRVLVSWP